MHSGLSLAALLGAIVASPNVHANDFYVDARISYDDASDIDIDAGPVLGELSLDRDLGFGAAFGRKFSAAWRFELEAMLRRQDIDALPALGLEALGGRVDVRTVMLNALYEVPIEGSSLRPYFGAGAGWASVDIDDASSVIGLRGEDDNAIGLQAMVGLALPLSDQLTLTMDARYGYVRANDVTYDIGDVRFDGETRIKTVSLLAGLRFAF